MISLRKKKFGCLVRREQPRPAALERNAVRDKRPPRAAMDVAADFVRVHGGGLHGDVAPPRLAQHVLHHELRHRTAADVPVADEQQPERMFRRRAVDPPVGVTLLARYDFHVRCPVREWRMPKKRSRTTIPFPVRQTGSRPFRSFRFSG